jgi:hypothetical protein
MAAQDVVTVQTVNATGTTVDVPVYIRDTGGTPLGMDRPAGSKIQSFSIKVSYSPAAAVSSVTFTRAGITAGLTPTSEFSPASAGAISLLDTFQESTNPIPFTLNAGAPGNQVAHLVFTLSSSAVPGSSISLTLDPALTQLTDAGGSAATKETPANGNLSLVNGAIQIAPLTITLGPAPVSVNTGRTAILIVTASASVINNTTVTLTSSNTSIATVPASVVITTGLRNATFNVAGIAAGSAIITASLPASDGGATATALVNVSVPCATLNAPVPSGPSTAQQAVAYTITWTAISGAKDYFVDEAAEPTFVTASTTNTLTTSATFVHDAGTFYYRVRAHSQAGSCNVTSLPSAPLTITVAAVPLPLSSVIPVVGSVAGNFGSFFRTSVQLYNPKSVTVSGRIVFHPQSVSGTDSDPSLAYSIAPRKTLAFADLLPAMGVAAGLGSADVVGDIGSPLPLVLARVFNDAGAGGTTGLTEEGSAIADALQPGDIGALFVPMDPTKFRLNIGVRTLDQNATLSITVTDKDGNIVAMTSKSYGPTFFQQVSSAAFLDGYAIAGGETISISMTSGKAFIYGTTTDNVTNDPSIQFARR